MTPTDKDFQRYDIEARLINDLPEPTTPKPDEIDVSEPIVLVPNDDGTTYDVQSGHAAIADLLAHEQSTVPAVIRLTDEPGRLVGGLKYRMGKGKSNPMLDAWAIADLKQKFGWTQTEIAKHVGCVQPLISNKLALLTLPEHLQKRLYLKQITFETARILVRLLKLKPELADTLENMPKITAHWADTEYRAAQADDAGLLDMREPDTDRLEELGIIMPEPTTPESVVTSINLTNGDIAALQMGNEIEIQIDGQAYMLAAYKKGD